jgi:hypothetical protein
MGAYRVGRAWWQRGESNPAWTPVAASGLRRTPSRGRSPERCPASYLRVAMLPTASAGAEVPPRRCHLACLLARSMPGLTASLSGSSEYQTAAFPGPQDAAVWLVTECGLGRRARLRPGCSLLGAGLAPDGQLSWRPRFRQRTMRRGPTPSPEGGPRRAALTGSVLQPALIGVVGGPSRRCSSRGSAGQASSRTGRGTLRAA